MNAAPWNHTNICYCSYFVHVLFLHHRLELSSPASYLSGAHYSALILISPGLYHFDSKHIPKKEIMDEAIKYIFSIATLYNI